MTDRTRVGYMFSSSVPVRWQHHAITQTTKTAPYEDEGRRTTPIYFRCAANSSSFILNVFAVSSETITCSTNTQYENYKFCHLFITGLLSFLKLKTKGIRAELATFLIPRSSVLLDKLKVSQLSLETP